LRRPDASAIVVGAACYGVSWIPCQRTYRELAQRLPNHHAVRFEKINDKEELILSPLEKLEETVSLVKLREAVVARFGLETRPPEEQLTAVQRWSPPQ
jgi:hypothetical protein